MIKINLLGDKVDYSGKIAMHIFVSVISLGIVLACCGFAHINIMSSKGKMEDLKVRLEARKVSLEAETAEVKDLESKKSLLQKKLNTISALKIKKGGPVKILDEVNRAVPELAWISEIRENSGVLQIFGVSLDNQTVAKFMRNLEAAEWVKTVGLEQAVLIEREGVKLAQFSITAKLVDPLEARVLDDQSSMEKKSNVVGKNSGVRAKGMMNSVKSKM